MSVGRGQENDAGYAVTRRIVNVAAGRNDTDAVNFAQFAPVQAQAAKNATQVAANAKSIDENAKSIEAYAQSLQANAENIEQLAASLESAKAEMSALRDALAELQIKDKEKDELIAELMSQLKGENVQN